MSSSAAYIYSERKNELNDSKPLLQLRCEKIFDRCPWSPYRL